MQDAPLTVWNEITISQSGIGITLYSESQNGGAVVEDEIWFTFDELEAKTGDIESLNLSEITEKALANAESQSAFETAQSEIWPNVGQQVYDNNPPSWSEDNRLTVVEISGQTVSEYVVQENMLGTDETVADANPSCDPDEPVVICEYVSGNGDEYAFPLSRLSAE